MGSNLIYFLIERSSLLINTTRSEENEQRSCQRFYDVNVFGKSKHSNYRAQLPNKSATNTNKAAGIKLPELTAQSESAVGFSSTFITVFFSILSALEEMLRVNLSRIPLCWFLHSQRFINKFIRKIDNCFDAFSLALLGRNSQLASTARAARVECNYVIKMCTALITQRCTCHA